MLSLVLKFLNKDFLKELRHIKKLSKLSSEEILDYQREKLKQIVLHSWRNVPYYKKILEEYGVIVNGEVHLENYSQLPILTKDILTEEWDNLKSVDYLKRNHYINYSGGSTGIPIKFIQDRDTWLHSIATKWFFFELIHKFPCRHIKLWGSERDILKEKKGMSGVIKNFIFKRKILDCFSMSEEKMRNYVRIINRYKPKILEAYVGAMYELAKFIESEKLSVHSPEGIITSAGTLYPYMKSKIEQVFNTKVLNRYGTREVGDVAGSCLHHDYLHIATWSHYTEILDNENNDVEPGETGQLIITLLTNYSMPLLRYDIGDIGVKMVDYAVECEINMPSLSSVVGREINVFKNKNGTIISGVFFIHFIGVVFNKQNIKKFQVIQEDYDRIRIKYVKSTIPLQNSDKTEIEQSIYTAMEEKCEIIWELVEDILPLPNGKYMYIISEI